MSSTLFFDLDGTLLDVRLRNLAVFHTVVDALSLPKVSDKWYWELKRNKQLPWEGLSERAIEDFRTAFRTEIEKSSYLSLDTVIPGMLIFLTDIKKNYDLVLLTNRQDKEQLTFQLKQLSLFDLFKTILAPYPTSKTDILTEYGTSTTDIYIGDTEEDIITARERKLISIAVTWGMRTEDYLQSYSPEFIAHTVDELRSLIHEISSSNLSGK